MAKVKYLIKQRLARSYSAYLLISLCEGLANLHPFKGEPNARLICNLHNGAPIKPEALHTMMTQLKKRILRLIETGEIKGEEEKKCYYINNNKRFNPYCIRHYAITSDSDYLPEYA